ncbi:hypothetical protein WJX84_000888 [Apatococcus fuscideae]|uniref:Protein CMSS1 n=1 Tax=Apatococcus fuscideae TaxID=2026836 RepID=A0AAW1SSW2_9CHLO
MAGLVKTSINRKRNIAKTDRATEGSQEPSEATVAKKPKTSAANLKPERKAKADYQSGQLSAAGLAELDTSGQADWLRSQHAAYRKSSFLEQEELTGGSFAALDSSIPLQQQIQQHIPDWSELCSVARFNKTNKTLARPSVLIVSASAPRANDLAKLLPNINKACKVSKLYAKHFKIEQQRAAMRLQGFFAAVGSPNRLLKLADLGDLHLEQLKMLMIDVQLDAKQRTILDIPETRTDFWKFYDAHCKPHVSSGTCMLALIDAARG